jgi:hypothetical protein
VTSQPKVLGSSPRVATTPQAAKLFSSFSPDGAKTMSDNDGILYKTGERLKLTVREPHGQSDCRANCRGNYIPTDYAGEVVSAQTIEGTMHLEVRWHLPAMYGYDTQKGTKSVLIHIANGVWLETRKKPKNVVATLTRITEEEYNQMIERAARITPE